MHKEHQSAVTRCSSESRVSSLEHEERLSTRISFPNARLCSSALHTPVNLAEFPPRARSSPQSESVMQSRACDDSCYYIWDCIVFSDDKLVEKRQRECVCQCQREKNCIDLCHTLGFMECVCVWRERPE